MSSALPSASACCLPTCDDAVTVQTPGPQGDAGADGAAGTNGQNAYTTFTASFTMPAELGSAAATVGSTAWMGLNQVLYAAKVDGTVVGYLQVTAITDATTCTLKNLEDAGNSAYPDNSAPGSIFIAGSMLVPGGVQGETGLLSGSVAGGDLKGTYPNPNIALANTLGAIIAGNGTDATTLSAGTNGHILSYDSSQATGLRSGALIPLTGSTNAATNRIPRLSAATGLPIPLVASKAQINEPASGTAGQIGAIVLDASAGNARGVDAVDLQVNRSNVTEVASGAESFLGGGDGNTASGARSVLCGGDANLVSSTEGVVCGGENNQAITGDRAVVVGGQQNVASGTESFIGGGQSNEASASHTTVSGGDNNTASAADATVGGGASNQATGANSTVAGGTVNVSTAQDTSVGGGSQNTASGTGATVAGGVLNTASGAYSSVLGGIHGVADKSGSIAHSGGRFAANGDAQVMHVVMRNATTDNTSTELFLDGASLRLSIPTNTSWVFHLFTVARDDQAGTAETSAWEVKGVITNDNGTTSLAAAVTSTTLVDDSGGAWTHTVSASDAQDALIITVDGEAGRNIRWVSRVTLVQVTF